MLLYKYLTFEAAIKVIQTASIGFSCVEDLNDPFECTAFAFKNDDTIDVPITVTVGAYRNQFSRKYVILSLTRQPLNALMWAHYGSSHQGVVIGVDVEEAGLTDSSTSVIPAQYGEIIYTATKPAGLNISSVDELMNIGNSFVKFNNDFYNLLKRAFLYKSVEWAYEEEVRVVKNLADNPNSYHFGEGSFTLQSGDWNQIQLKEQGRPVYCLKIPVSSIRKIYIGRYAYQSLVSRRNILNQEEYSRVINGWEAMGIEIKYCEADPNSWQLTERC